MLGYGRGRGTIAGPTRVALVIGAVALGVSLAGCAHGPAAGPAASGAATRPTASQPTASGGAASPGAVPWQSVGADWVLDTYSTASYPKRAPVTLYLVSPAGAKYPLFTWPASATPATLLAWAGDKTQALFAFYPGNGQPSRYGELNLMTGTMTRVAFPGTGTVPLGYTPPDGQELLGTPPNGSDNAIARYTQAGALVRTLVTGNDAYDASYSPDGTALAVAAPGGLQLIGNAGGVLGTPRVPGAARACEPARWWNAATILADCSNGLWLVPASGAAPTRLTPARGASFDLGDIDAWRLPSGLYLQSYGACGTYELNKQASSGTVTRVTVPGMTYSPVVVTASATELLIEQQGCHGSGGNLAWYNPATGAEQWIFTA